MSIISITRRMPLNFLAISFFAQLVLCSVAFGSALANPSAPVGGTLLGTFGSEPATLNPISSTDLYARNVHRLVMDTLMKRNIDTYEYEPAMAEKVEVSKDNMVFTFTLREGLVFSDGKPVTAEDVKFSFDVIFDDKWQTAHLRPYYDAIEKAEVIDARTIRFTAKRPYFETFSSICDIFIAPKHVYGNAEKGRKMNKTLTGSGPYKLKEYRQGHSLVLERNPSYWGYSNEAEKGKYNFAQIRYRFDGEENLILERLKKGELDFSGISSEAFHKKTDGKPWGGTLLKKKVENREPKSYGYVGWNLTKDLFKDKKVRRALAMLMNREEMNQKFRYGMSMLATGPWYQQSEYANPKVKAIPFDPKAAAKLLADAGWKDSNKDGVLDKNGQAFEFTLLNPSKDVQKYFVMYQEDLKKAGIKMNIQLIEFSALLKSLDDAKFDAFAMAWGGGNVDHNPKQIWHSDSRAAGGSNRIGYSNPEVDKLIDEGIATLDKAKRIKIYQKIYELIADDAPYLFLFNDRYALYGINKRIGQVRDTYGYEIGSRYWWHTQPK